MTETIEAPMARPSRPSVRFTAFDEPTMISRTNTMYSAPKGIKTIFRPGISTWECRFSVMGTNTPGNSSSIDLRLSRRWASVAPFPVVPISR